MANPPKDSERLQLRIEKRIADPMRAEVQRLKLVNLQALVTKILEHFVATGCQLDTQKTIPPTPDIDLRALLMEAHRANTEANKIIGEANRTIARLSDANAKLTDTITAITQERKGGPSESAAKGKG